MNIPDELLEPLIHLRKLLEIYINATKNCKELLELLVQQIEEIRGVKRNNSFVETLIKEYNYPRKFLEIPETIDLEPFYLTN